MPTEFLAGSQVQILPLEKYCMGKADASSEPTSHKFCWPHLLSLLEACRVHVPLKELFEHYGFPSRRWMVSFILGVLLSLAVVGWIGPLPTKLVALEFIAFEDKDKDIVNRKLRPVLRRPRQAPTVILKMCKGVEPGLSPHVTSMSPPQREVQTIPNHCTIQIIPPLESIILAKPSWPGSSDVDLTPAQLVALLLSLPGAAAHQAEAAIPKLSQAISPVSRTS